MADSGTTSPPPLPPTPLTGWEAIDEQRSFYHEQDCLYPGNNLVSEKLRNRQDDEVVIFDYSLDPDYLSDESDEFPLEQSNADDIFFRVSKEQVGSDRFNQIINFTRGTQPGEEGTRGQRLAIIDFPQCYDTSDEGTLNSMAAGLHLPSEPDSTFGKAHSGRVLGLPGPKDFKTGISLRAPFKEPSEVPKSGLSEGRFILFASFPYFGEHDRNVPLGARSERESVRLLEFKRLGARVPGRRASAGKQKGKEKEGENEKEEVGEDEVEEERDDIGDILVHQARYMIFDNYTMATFRSKEDSANCRVPLHRYQERVGAFRAMIHMIANRTDLELWTLEKLQASLCKLEKDIDRMILDAKTYENTLGIEMTNADELSPEQLEEANRLSGRERERWREDCERDNLQRRKSETYSHLSTGFRLLFSLLSA
ncbi:unnamed protein product [Tuber aestivum]|uniref:Uncharacterized protein n=1 Tax=Tuber aestivum TaxID=59557 RepID=A0A292PZ86_9PEZI|nr:unnamed protein product [Tuber aestivum]